MAWGFYGRTEELAQMAAILARRRWFFAKITGRRRIGKTTLIHQAIPAGSRPVFYVQLPDSGPAGVLSAVADAFAIFSIPETTAVPPTSLGQLATMVGVLARAGYVIILDEFQYLNRERLRELASHLQRVVDQLTADASNVPGGLVVLGSLQTEMAALLEDAAAPLYQRVTDEIHLGHLDLESLVALLGAHADLEPERLLFLWTLFEGVPKFYRDCFEQDVLRCDRPDLLRRAFFQSSSPLRTEADNWFLKELSGRYDVVLKYIARHPGCSHADLLEHARGLSGEAKEQVGGYLKVLTDRYQLIERRLPIFAKPTAKSGRYYISDNFLRAWLAALASQVAAMNFAPIDDLVATSDRRLAEVEGHALEKLAGTLYAELSRKQRGDFQLSARIHGYWDKNDTEIDLVALDEANRRIRFASCKRNAARLISGTNVLDGHIARFLSAQRQYASWAIERVGIAPRLGADERVALERAGHLGQDLAELTARLR